MFTNELEFKGFKPFDHIAGCNLGTWTDRETAAAIIETIDKAGAAAMRRAGADTLKLCEDLARCADEDIDVSFYSDELINWCEDLLPPWCFFYWEDGEFRVIPDAENAQFDLDQIGMTGEELPEDGSPADEFLLINDHGNATLYSFDGSKREWLEVWSVV